MAMNESKMKVTEGGVESGGGDARVGRCESMAVATFLNCLILSLGLVYFALLVHHAVLFIIASLVNVTCKLNNVNQF